MQLLQTPSVYAASGTIFSHSCISPRWIGILLLVHFLTAWSAVTHLSWGCRYQNNIQMLEADSGWAGIQICKIHCPHSIALEKGMRVRGPFLSRAPLLHITLVPLIWRTTGKFWKGSNNVAKSQVQAQSFCSQRVRVAARSVTSFSVTEWVFKFTLGLSYPPWLREGLHETLSWKCVLSSWSNAP